MKTPRAFELSCLFNNKRMTGNLQTLLSVPYLMPINDNCELIILIQIYSTSQIFHNDFNYGLSDNRLFQVACPTIDFSQLVRQSTFPCTTIVFFVYDDRLFSETQNVRLIALYDDRLVFQRMRQTANFVSIRERRITSTNSLMNSLILYIKT